MLGADPTAGLGDPGRARPGKLYRDTRIATLTLSICGHDNFNERLGQNTRYASLGNAASAALLGVAASTISEQAVLLVTACLVVLPLTVLQALDGVSAAVFGLMPPLIAADLTKRTGEPFA